MDVRDVVNESEVPRSMFDLVPMVQYHWLLFTQWIESVNIEVGISSATPVIEHAHFEFNLEVPDTVSLPMKYFSQAKVEKYLKEIAGRKCTLVTYNAMEHRITFVGFK